MATNINIFYSNFRTGTNVTIQRRLLDMTINWIDDTGQPQTRTETVTFPDILTQVPVQFRDDLLQEIAIRLLRAKTGVDG